MIGILLKLAFSGIRARRLASVITVILTAAAATTVVLTLEVGSTVSDPWTRTFDAANGAHVLANVTTEAEARSIANLDGVIEANELAPIVRTTMVIDGEDQQILLTGFSGRPHVNSPIVTEGSGDFDSGVVIERSFADVLGIKPGDEVAFQTENGVITAPVSGTAISPSQSRYPRSNPGVAWVSRSFLEQIAPNQGSWRWTQAVRLASPISAPSVAAKVGSSLPPGTFSVETWQDQRDNALLESQPIRVILGVYTLLLMIVSYSVIAILIGARVTSQQREIALLRAIGLTPRQVSAAFAVEALVVGFVGVLVGFAVGAILAPRLAAPSAATLIGSPEVHANPAHILFACVAVLPVIFISAYAAARRSTRATVQQSLRGVTTIPGNHALVSKALSVVRVPLSIELGFKDLFAKRSRAMWLMLAIIVTSAAMVVTLSVQSALNDRPAGEPSDVPRELPVLVYTLDSVLALVSVTALAGVALLSVRERIRDFGILRTIGLTPSQVTSSLVGAHAALAALGALISIPIGVALYVVLYQGASGESPPGTAPWWWLAAVPFVMVVATALATSVPARLAARVPTAEAVRYE